MHPSQNIYCNKSTTLKKRKIIMGITGSIAANECFQMIRELVKNGADVYTVITEAAVKLVALDSLEFASGHRPITELTGKAEHISSIQEHCSDTLFLVYPATCDTISKIACGICDTTVTSVAVVAIGAGIPVLIVPAMHESMYKSPAINENIKRIESWGVQFLGPRIDSHQAKIASMDQVLAWVSRMLSHDGLRGKHVLIIGGRSEEPIDSIRVITNNSTGIMAISLAKRAFERGAYVDLWMGECSVKLPEYTNIRRFSRISQLHKMVDDINHDIVIVPAALSDFILSSFADGKIPSSNMLSLDLKPAQKVLPAICSKCDMVIGFKTEFGLNRQSLVCKARTRLQEYGLYAIVANDASAIGSESSSVTIVTNDNDYDITGTKLDVSDAILDFCVKSK